MRDPDRQDCLSSITCRRSDARIPARAVPDRFDELQALGGRELQKVSKIFTEQFPQTLAHPHPPLTFVT
jgi:hypothetical protein